MSAPSKSQRAYEVIRSRIVEGRYGPGFRLVLDQLARELSVSPVPVREALRRLEAERLVRFERHVGATVTAIDPAEYQYAMESLAVVEGAATALAAPLLTPADLAAAEDTNARMRRSLRDFDPLAFTSLNREFHRALYAPCPNPHLIELVAQGWRRLAAIRHSTFSFVPGRAEASVAEHDALLVLVRGGADPAVIEGCARRHRLATSRAFLSRDTRQEVPS